MLNQNKASTKLISLPLSNSELKQKFTIDYSKVFLTSLSVIYFSLFLFVQLHYQLKGNSN